MKRIREVTIRRFNNLSFRRKILLTVIILLFVPVSIFGGILYQIVSKNYYEQALQSVNIQIDEKTDKLNGRFDRGEQALYQFALDSRIVASLQQEYKDFAEFVEEYTQMIAPSFVIMTKLNPMIQRWHLYTNGPLNRFRTVATPISEVEEETWFQLLTANKGTVWTVREGKLNAEVWQPVIFSPKLRNVIEFQYDLSAMFEDLELTGVDFEVQVRNLNDGIVYGFREDVPGLLQENRAGEEMEIDGVQVNVFSRDLKPNDWKLCYFVPSSQLLFGEKYFLAAETIIVVLTSFILIIIGSVFSKILIDRIETLNENVKSVAYSGISQPLHTETQDEIGELSNSVAVMFEENQRITREVYENKLALKKAELTALQAQIKPHFLYNSLSLINWYAIRSNQSEISEMAVMLGKFYRTMVNQGDIYLRVLEEWQCVEAYLFMQRMFHNGRMELEMSITKEAKECIMPHFIIQPLVENAIEHGIDKRKSRDGWIRVLCWIEDGQVCWCVEDDGPGFEQEDPQTVLEMQSSGYGIHNVKERLSILYENRYSLHLENRIEGGARVLLKIPEKYSEDTVT